MSWCSGVLHTHRVQVKDSANLGRDLEVALIHLDSSWFFQTLSKETYWTFVLLRFATSSVLGHDKGTGRAHGTVQISWLSESCRVMFRAHVLKNVPFRSKHASFLLDDFASWNFLYYGPIAITSNSVFRFDNQSEAGRSMQNCLSGLPLIQTRRWRDPRLILMEVTTLQLKWP